MSVDMTGTHPDFLSKGITQPLAWDLEGEFDNLVLDVDESGDAHIERRVSGLKSSGHHQDEKFGMTWSRERDRAVPDEAELKTPLDRFTASLISSPPRIRVGRQGHTRTDSVETRRIVMRRGMMYWPIPADKTAWTSLEEIAVPILHDRIQLTFKNSIQDIRGGIATIAAPVALENDAKDFKVSGGAKAEFDIAAGRLKSLELEIRIAFSAKAPLPGGGEGDVSGVATYRESQRLVQ